VEDVTERRTAEQARARTQANLTAVATVVKRIQSGADARQAVVDACADLAGASFVSLAQPDADGTVLRVTASTAGGLVGTAAATGVPSATVTVFRTGLPHFSASAARDPAIAPSLLALTGARSVYLLPVCAAGSTIGVLIVAWSRKVPDTQDPRASVVTLLVDHAGVAIRQAALTAELADMALADALTGLPNRRSWDGRAAVALAAARRSGRPLVVALADVDRFKDFNDVHGHAAGDAVLRHFAAAARAVVREVDTVARWGGEEFAFALPDCGARQAAVVLDRVRQATRTEGVTCSIGFAEWDGVEDEAGLMARCDRALYAAKRAGRDRVVADPDGPRAPAG
jgi:diguanylate cyclase (GGDEF)-like protein